jgi:hypothetical protein
LATFAELFDMINPSQMSIIFNRTAISSVLKDQELRDKAEAKKIAMEKKKSK